MKAEVATTKSYIDQYRTSLNDLRNTMSGQKYQGTQLSSSFNKSFGARMGKTEFENKVQQRQIFNYQERPIEQPQIIYQKRPSYMEGIEKQYEKIKTQTQDIGKSAYKLPSRSLKDNYINFQATANNSKAQSRSQTPGNHSSQLNQKRIQQNSNPDKANTLNIVEKHLSQLKEIQNLTGPSINSKKQTSQPSGIRDQRPPVNRLSSSKRLKGQSSSKAFSSITSQKSTVSSFKENEQSPSTPSNPTQIDSNQEQNYSNSFKLVGLKNLGNTCFMNSILQCVFGTQHLTKFFKSDNFEKQLSKAQRNQPLAKAYSNILSKIYSGSSSYLIPSDLKYVMAKKSSQFQGYSQQDAQEFLRCFIDAMHEELNRVNHKPPYKEIDFEKYSWAEQGEGWWSYNKQRDDSIIADIFEGQLMSKIQCQLCGFASLAFDNFMDLSIPIPRKKAVTLGDCLEDFIYDEVMDKCGYKCKKCHREDNFKKQMTVWRFPKVLVIHLKRFQNTYMRREKLNTAVDIPSHIDLQELAPHSNHKSKNHAKYDLYAISHHSGSLNGGHYVADVKSSDNKWYRCNDSTISKISMADSKQSQSAYVLFYQMREQKQIDTNISKL